MGSSYLFKSREGIYYFRLVVPGPLRVAVGKTELRRSLRTRSKREALVEAAKLLLEAQELLGSAMGRRGGNVPATAAAVPSEPAHTPKLSQPDPKLSELFETYRLSQLREGVSLKTIDDKEAVIRLLCLICRNKRIDYYTLDDAKMFREKALQLPPLALRTLQRHPEKSLSDLIGRGNTTISVTTYNNYIKNLSTVFAYAKKEGVSTNNPFSYMKIHKKVKASSYRDAFTSEEVALIFESTAKYRHTKRDFKYWLPRLAYCSGARLNELCQLYSDDVRLINDVACIHIRAGRPDQRLKTPAAERVVPVHSKLVELGFLDYVKSQGGRIFPTLRHSEKHGYSATPSRWFGRFKVDIGLVGDDSGKKDFHSFRHTVADELKQKGVSENLIGGVLGHITGGLTNTRYGKDYKPEVLKPVIEMLEPEQTPQGADMIEAEIERLAESL